MKKLPVIFLLALIVCSGIISGCVKETGGRNATSTQKKTESSTEKEAQSERETQPATEPQSVTETQSATEPQTVTEAQTETEPQPTTEAQSATEPQPTTAGGNSPAVTRRISELEISGEKITDITTRDMKQYDYVRDIYISIDESKKDVNITVQVPSATDKDTAKMAGEDVARYLAAMAGSANSYFKLPGSEDLGGIYDNYDLLIYVDDGYKNIALYGAKVTTSDKITWR